MFFIKDSRRSIAGKIWKQFFRIVVSCIYSRKPNKPRFQAPRLAEQWAPDQSPLPALGERPGKTKGTTGFAQPAIWNFEGVPQTTVRTKPMIIKMMMMMVMMMMMTMAMTTSWWWWHHDDDDDIMMMIMMRMMMMMAWWHDGMMVWRWWGRWKWRWR